MRPLVYIAAPFAEAPVLWTTRVSTLSRWLVGKGYAPVSIHAAIQTGAYGDDTDPDARAAGLDAACSIVRAVACSGGAMILITRDDRTMSNGCKKEAAAFRKSGRWNAEDLIVRAKWATWEAWMEMGYWPAPPMISR